VIVVWDNGKCANYRCSGTFDICILDTSSAGKKHDAVQCSGCSVTPICGIRWACADCLSNGSNINLCSNCYHNDEHDLRHHFYRLITPTSEKVLVTTRRKSKRIIMKGNFAGARVVPGVDFKSSNVNIGDCKRGRILEIKVKIVFFEI
jgi:E3 ubiquitin-protein ligase mind-bomb